jgi:glycosyltransferase involved in cell wall biosynthesis
MTEALACGTPVMARPYGSVPEILRDGVTSYTASDLEAMVGQCVPSTRETMLSLVCLIQFSFRQTA